MRCRAAQRSARRKEGATPTDTTATTARDYTPVDLADLLGGELRDAAKPLDEHCHPASTDKERLTSMLA